MFKRLALVAALSPAASIVAFAAPVTYKIDPEPHRRGRQLEPLRLLQPDRPFRPGRWHHRLRRRQRRRLQGRRSPCRWRAWKRTWRTSTSTCAAPTSSTPTKYPDDHLQEHQGRGRRRQASCACYGDLTVHGVTKPVVLDVTINKVGEHPMSKRAAVGFDATTTIKRSDFGVDKYAPNVSDAGHHPHHHRGDGAEGRRREVS